MIRVKVPATSANMGPGFDCLGTALDLYNTFEFEEIQEGLEIIGCEERYSGTSNLIYTSMDKCFKKTGYQPKGLRIRITSQIPISRGLGSSASCIIGGLLAANQLSGEKLSKEELLEIANEIEGHPDNVAPALLGGMVIAIQEEGKVFYDKISLSDNLGFCAMIPDFTLSTKEARAVLPKNLTYRDAIYNISRASLLTAALSNGNHQLLRFACKDALHQPYRRALIPGYDEIVSKCGELNFFGVFLSGAGPTMMALYDPSIPSVIHELQVFLSRQPHKWTVRELAIDAQGALLQVL